MNKLRRGRPKKVRFIQKMPKVVQFSPRGKPGRPDEVELTLDQFEALKLADFQGYKQEHGALAMRISRASFGRILREARRRVAEALVQGKIVKIRMGDVQVGVRKSEFNREALEKEVEAFRLRTQKMVQDAQGIAADLESGGSVKVEETVRKV